MGNPSIEVLGRLLDCLRLELSIVPNVPADGPSLRSQIRRFAIRPTEFARSGMRRAALRAVAALPQESA